MKGVEAVHGRRFLAALIERHGERPSDLSRFLGRPARYLSDHLRRGSPRQLAPDEIDTLARYFRVRPVEIGAH